MEQIGPVHPAATILAEVRKRPDIFMIGVAGIPGSGKSTLAQAVASFVPGSIIVPMDGYHIPRCRLDAEGLRQRGAGHTFDAFRFREDMERLHRTRCGVFPAFDHAEKDPQMGAIHVTARVPLVIVEGLYVLMRDWGAEGFFDLKVFLDCDGGEAESRLFRRHLETGVAATPDEAWQRATTSDRLNAAAILADGCRERAHLVVTGQPPEA